MYCLHYNRVRGLCPGLLFLTGFLLKLWHGTPYVQA